MNRLFTYVVLLIFCTYYVPGKISKGYCSERSAYGNISKTPCNKDIDCQTEEKCCRKGDTMMCVSPVPYEAYLGHLKPGSCPKMTRSKQKNPKCTVDQDCRGELICCEDRCIVPLPAPPEAKDFYCPEHSGVNLVNTTCRSDSECPGSVKCCQVEETSLCTEPSYLPAPRKSGHCPKIENDKHLMYSKLCNGDSDCFGGEKCCPTSETFRCQPAMPSPPPPKQGSCGTNSVDWNLMALFECEDDYDCVGAKKCCYEDFILQCVYV
uniref:WAP domain-containing protein n=1 Tax=Trichuris muris TaxID=70415 RepID=A0A5S6QLV9_TRIMR